MREVSDQDRKLTTCSADGFSFHVRAEIFIQKKRRGDGEKRWKNGAKK
jgi:hypothetical protein